MTDATTDKGYPEDWDDSGGDFEPIPNDVYEFNLHLQNIGESKNEQYMAAIELTVDYEGDTYNGRKLWDNVMLEGKGLFGVYNLCKAIVALTPDMAKPMNTAWDKLWRGEDDKVGVERIDDGADLEAWNEFFGILEGAKVQALVEVDTEYNNNKVVKYITKIQEES